MPTLEFVGVQVHPLNGELVVAQRWEILWSLPRRMHRDHLLRDRVFVLESRMTNRAFPDLEVVIHSILAEGERVVVHKSFRGTQLEPWRGIKPKGKRVEWELISIYGIRGGKIVEYWGVESMMKTLD